MRLIPDVIRRIDQAIVEKLLLLRAVHAGVVLVDSKALLLPGRSGTGKSSMVAELLRHGASYLSDEYALIDGQGLVHSYPRPLLLRDGSRNGFPVLAPECSVVTPSSPVPVGWIMELEYRNSGQSMISPVSKGEGFLSLLRNTPHLLTEAPDLIDKFYKAAEPAQCFVGNRTDAVHAARDILRLM
jgi:hypothetical protein